jgi:hypothetical protein
MQAPPSSAAFEVSEFIADGKATSSATTFRVFHDGRANFLLTSPRVLSKLVIGAVIDAFAGSDGKAPLRSVRLTGQMRAIAPLVTIVEVLKRRMPGLHQQSDIFTRRVSPLRSHAGAAPLADTGGGAETGSIESPDVQGIEVTSATASPGSGVSAIAGTFQASFMSVLLSLDALTPTLIGYQPPLAATRNDSARPNASPQVRASAAGSGATPPDATSGRERRSKGAANSPAVGVRPDGAAAATRSPATAASSSDTSTPTATGAAAEKPLAADAAQGPLDRFARPTSAGSGAFGRAMPLQRGYRGGQGRAQRGQPFSSGAAWIAAGDDGSGVALSGAPPRTSSSAAPVPPPTRMSNVAAAFAQPPPPPPPPPVGKRPSTPPHEQQQQQQQQQQSYGYWSLPAPRGAAVPASGRFVDPSSAEMHTRPPPHFSPATASPTAVHASGSRATPSFASAFNPPSLTDSNMRGGSSGSGGGARAARDEVRAAEDAGIARAVLQSVHFQLPHSQSPTPGTRGAAGQLQAPPAFSHGPAAQYTAPRSVGHYATPSPLGQQQHQQQQQYAPQRAFVPSFMQAQPAPLHQLPVPVFQLVPRPQEPFVRYPAAGSTPLEHSSPMTTSVAAFTPPTYSQGQLEQQHPRRQQRASPAQEYPPSDTNVLRFTMQAAPRSAAPHDGGAAQPHFGHGSAGAPSGHNAPFGAVVQHVGAPPAETSSQHAHAPDTRGRRGRARGRGTPGP